MELDWEKSGDFLMRMFAPAVELFAQELEFDVHECYESAEHWEWLKKTRRICSPRKTTRNMSRTS